MTKEPGRKLEQVNVVKLYLYTSIFSSPYL